MTNDLKVSLDLTGREAKCDICKTVQPSLKSLAYFTYKPDKDFDGFYCGCIGWD